MLYKLRYEDVLLTRPTKGHQPLCHVQTAKQERVGSTAVQLGMAVLVVWTQARNLCFGRTQETTPHRLGSAKHRQAQEMTLTPYGGVRPIEHLYYTRLQAKGVKSWKNVLRMSFSHSYSITCSLQSASQASRENGLTKDVFC